MKAPSPQASHPFTIGEVMKTNMQIELDNEQRKHLADIYDNIISPRLITRKELAQLVHLYIEELLKDEKTSKQIIEGIAQDGWKYYYNDKRVTKEEFNRRSNGISAKDLGR